MSRRAVMVLSAVTAALALVATVTPGTAAAKSSPQISITCPSDNLQTAISNALPGTTIALSGTCIGNFTIDRNLTIVGSAILDGDGDGVVLTIEHGVRATISNLTIQHGYHACGSYCDVRGAGIVNLGSLTVRSSTVADNELACLTQCETLGVGIYNEGPLYLAGSSVSNNTAWCQDGCVHYGVGLENFYGTVTVSSSTVSGNQVTCDGGCADSLGAGIATYRGPLSVKDSDIDSNDAGQGSGGGVEVFEATASISGTSISDNSANVDGAGVWLTGATVTVSRSTISDNSAGVHGGGVFTCGTFTAVKSAIANNTPDNVYAC